MTTATLNPHAAARARGGHGFRTAARMEWRKLRTVRSTWYIAAAFAASMVGLAMLALSHEGYAQMSAADRGSFDPTHDCFVGLVLPLLFAPLSPAVRDSSACVRRLGTYPPGRLNHQPLDHHDET
jgi:hypothetical protein